MKIRSLRRNKKQKGKSVLYDRFSVNNSFLVTRNKLDIFPEIYKRLSSNDKYEKFVSAHLEAAAECIHMKLRAKCWVPR